MVKITACLLMTRQPQVPDRRDFAEEIRPELRKSLPLIWPIPARR